LWGIDAPEERERGDNRQRRGGGKAKRGLGRGGKLVLPLFV